MEDLDTLLKQLKKSIVPLFHNDKPKWGKSILEFIGTGILVEQNGNYYIITAGHVIENYALKKARNEYKDKDDYDEVSDSFFTLENIRILCGDFYPIRRTKFVYGDRGTIENVIDIAILYLDSESWDEILPNFKALTSNDIIFDYTIKNSDYYLICGYPACWVEYIRDDNNEESIQIRLFSLLTKGIDNEEFCKFQINQKYNFLFSYSLDLLKRENQDVDLQGFSPRDISGCGVWCFNADMIPKLIGIAIEDATISYNKPYMIATRIDEAFYLIKSDKM